MKQAMKETMRKFYVLDEDEIFEIYTDIEMSRDSVIKMLIGKISKKMRNSFLNNIYGVNNQEVETLIKELEEETFQAYSKIE